MSSEMSNDVVNSQTAQPFGPFVEPCAPPRHGNGHVHPVNRRWLRVLKFGGTSVGDATCIQRVAEIIDNNCRESDIVVVVSAMSGVTNKLVEAADQAERGNLAATKRIFDAIRQQHEAVIEVVISSKPDRDRILRGLANLVDDCERLCADAAQQGQLSPRDRDLILSLGERLSAPLIAAVLATRTLASEPFEATKLIVTDAQHGAADPNLDLTGKRCEEYLRPILRRGSVPVVTGFIGATEQGVLTTLGRGGSDYSATILAAALKADEVIIWTDVDGMLSADPRLVPDATTIPEISYREASELAHFGAKVLHPKSLRPVMKQDVPVWIRNTFSPEKTGTKISTSGCPNLRGVKALTSIGDAALITVGTREAHHTQELFEQTRAVTKTLAVDVLMLSNAHKHISLVVAAVSAQRTLEALRREFAPSLAQGKTNSVRVDSTVAIVTVVGENLQEVKSIVARAIDELERENVRVLATGQGSDCNCSFVVAKKDIKAALARTHRQLKPRARNNRSADPLPGNGNHRQSAAIPPIPLRIRRETEDKDPVVLSGSNRVLMPAAQTGDDREFVILDEPSFRKMIARERKRTERSRKPALLMLMDAGDGLPFDRSSKLLSNILAALSVSTRETDVIGWYKGRSVVGVMFTEITMEDPGAILGTMMHRVSDTLRSKMSLEQFSQMRVSWHMFPENWEQETIGNPALYPDLEHLEMTRRTSLAIKRYADILGSAAALLFFSPIFLLVAILVKLGSKGPILYKQERLGQFGKPFTFLKFRSMYTGNDRTIHQEFMKKVIKGKYEGHTDPGEEKVYKMKNDPRITPIGRFLRRTSLDELPQFINVLRGDMSLVGPRPPIPYECQEYDIWHRRRVLEVKPGITGLWQVKGRSRVRFDDMVRLDLQYVRTWSLWLDFQILLKTPAAVLWGADAF
jgi:aspartate kinase